MRLPLRLIFLGLVLAEIAAFIIVGKAIGVIATLALTLLGVAAGMVLLRWTGVSMLVRIRAEMAAGRTPARPFLDAGLKALAAALLMLPGLVTDLIALLLLIPQTREAMWRAASRRLDAKGLRPAFSGRRAPVIELDQSEYMAGPRQDRR
jgi:UPF0716 protein FxsA